MPTTALQFAPRTPVVFNRKSGSPDYEDDYTARLRKWREAVREEALATRRMHPEYDNIQSYIRMLSGEHWDPRRPRYRSRFVDNRMNDARQDTLASLTDIRPFMDIGSYDEAFRDKPEIIEKVIGHEWQRGRIDMRLVSAIDHALFGSGYWKIGALAPGFLVVTACGMDNVIPIQPASQLQDAAGVLYRTYKNLSYFWQIWEDKAKGLEREQAKAQWAEASNQYVRPGRIPEYTWNALSPQMQRHLGRGGHALRATAMGDSPFPIVPLEEYWIDDFSINESVTTVVVKDPNLDPDSHNYWYEVKPGERLFPRKRLIVFGGDRPMSDGPSPYWHGLYPFAELTLDPVVWAPGGFSEYRNLKEIQGAINEIPAGVLDAIKRALNQQMITRDGAVAKASWDRFFADMPGGKLRMTPIANPQQDLRYAPVPQLPGYVYQFLVYLIQTFDRRAGRLDINRMIGKKQVPGGDTIEQMRDAMGSPGRLKSRFVEWFLEDAALQAVSNVFQYFGKRRRMMILGGPGLTREDFDFDPGSLTVWSMPKEDHWKLFPVMIKPGSMHGATRAQEKIYAFTLYRAGAISRRELLRRIEWPSDPDLIERELAQERAAGLGATAAGRVPRMTRGQRTGKPF